MHFMMHVLATLMFVPGGGDNTDRAQPPCHSTATPEIVIEPGDRKGQLLKKIHEQLIASKAPFFGEGDADEVQGILARLPANAPPMQLINLKARLAEDLLNVG